MRKQIQARATECYFCVNNTAGPDFRDAQFLGKFVSAGKKILPQRRSGLCAKHQRKVARAIKQARTMAIMPYMPPKK